MGIYLNQPKAVELKIIYNKRDAAKVKDPSKILKVNRDNVKFGKSKNLDARHREYKEIFGENTNFKIILQISDYGKLVAFENQLKKVFEPFCLRSPSNGVQMEWMEKISFEDAENKAAVLEEIIFKYVSSNISESPLCCNCKTSP